MIAVRNYRNPLIKPADVESIYQGFEVLSVFNAAVTKFKGQTILLLRIALRPINDNPKVVKTAVYDCESKKIVTKTFDKNDGHNDFSDPRLIVTNRGTFLTSISHLQIARSSDGVHFKLDENCFMASANEYEAFGLEDPHITYIDNEFLISYVSVSSFGVTTSLAITKDFKQVERKGVIFCPENRDVVIFPDKINDKYAAIHRPLSPLFARGDIWLSQSDDLQNWGEHKRLEGFKCDEWNCQKIGASCVPFLVDEGWLLIYHGVDELDRYSIGAMLLDKKCPQKVIAKTNEPILIAETEYEKTGIFRNVVFSCGAILDDGIIKIYYGAADKYLCLAEAKLTKVMAMMA